MKNSDNRVANRKFVLLWKKKKKVPSKGSMHISPLLAQIILEASNHAFMCYFYTYH